MIETQDEVDMRTQILLNSSWPSITDITKQTQSIALKSDLNNKTKMSATLIYNKLHFFNYYFIMFPELHL